MVKLGIVGAGRIGRLHAENIVSQIREAKLVGIADVFLNDEIKNWAQGLDIPKVTSDVQEIFNDPEIEGILICSPSTTHEEYIIKAAKQGKHIFCEKPIGSDISKIKEALRVVDSSGVKLQIGFVRRFDHNHKKVHDTVVAGKIGKPHLVKITSRDPKVQPIEYLRTSGGLFFDMTIHDFDMARYLSNSDVEEVFVHAGVLIDPAIAEINDFDTAIVTMKFKNGMLGVIENCREAAYGYDQRTEVHGSEGCVMADNDQPNTSKLLTANGILSETFLWFFVERYKEAFAAEVKAFVDVIATNSEPLVTGIDGLKAVLIARAADESARENKPIKVEEV